MKKSNTLFLLLFLIKFANSQNLVLNPSFEDTIPCAVYAGNLPQLRPYFWFTPSSGSPDFMDVTTNCAWGGGVPQNVFGYQYPKTGSAMFGFNLYHPLAPFMFREYIEGTLNDTLKQGHKYCVEFFVSLSDNSTHAIDRFGVYFSEDSIYDWNTSSLLFYNPQIENQPGNIITDTMNWVSISGEYIAQGGEKYLTIGNFYDDANTDTLGLGYGSPSVGSYYFIDDVSVIDCTVGIEEIKGEISILNIFPNPVINELSFNYSFSKNKDAYLEVYNVLSQKVKKVPLKTNVQTYRVNVPELSEGIYYCKLFVEGKWEATGKFIKINQP
ncbi:MAG: T9SS type A sorting domain-containing protein [Bacteroidia bacterium]